MQQEQWQQWRAERMAELREPHGWLSLVNLEVLSSRPEALESFPGIWSADDHVVHAVFRAEDQVFQDGEQVTGQVTLEIPQGESDTSLSDSAGRIAEVASRLGKIVVRTRDPQAPTRTEFSQTDTYPFDPRWVVEGPWEGFESPVSVPILSVYKDTPTSLPILGKATFLGREMLVSGQDMESLKIIFHDKTNGDTTEGWRSAPVTVQGDRATVDFNRAVNFPAHFTPFGTCPTPPEGNTFDTPVTAGERKIQ